MFETLKRKMVLNESKRISEDSLNIICENMELDEQLSDIMLEEVEITPEDEEELEKELGFDDLDSDEDGELDVDEDDLDEESALMEEMDSIEKFVGQDAPAEYSDIDLDCEETSMDIASKDAPYEYESIDLDLDIL